MITAADSFQILTKKVAMLALANLTTVVKRCFNERHLILNSTKFYTKLAIWRKAARTQTKQWLASAEVALFGYLDAADTAPIWYPMIMTRRRKISTMMTIMKLILSGLNPPMCGTLYRHRSLIGSLSVYLNSYSCLYYYYVLPLHTVLFTLKD